MGRQRLAEKARVLLDVRITRRLKFGGERRT